MRALPPAGSSAFGRISIKCSPPGWSTAVPVPSMRSAGPWRIRLTPSMARSLSRLFVQEALVREMQMDAAKADQATEAVGSAAAPSKAPVIA